MVMLIFSFFQKLHFPAKAHALPNANELLQFLL